jgi:hypothetical protein
MDINKQSGRISGLFFAFRRLSGKQKEKILCALCAFAVKYHLPWFH